MASKAFKISTQIISYLILVRYVVSAPFSHQFFYFINLIELSKMTTLIANQTLLVKTFLNRNSIIQFDLLLLERYLLPHTHSFVGEHSSQAF